MTPLRLHADEIRGILKGTTTMVALPITDPIPPTYRIARCEEARSPTGRVTPRAIFETTSASIRFEWSSLCPLGSDTVWVQEDAYISRPDFSDYATMQRDGNKIDDKGWPRIVGWVASMDVDAIRVAEDYGVKRTLRSRMPRWAARLFLRTTSARVIRAKDLTWEDAKSLGAREVSQWPHTDPVQWSAHYPNWGGHPLAGSPSSAIWQRWDETHRSPKWNENPWVWLVGVTKVESP